MQPLEIRLIRRICLTTAGVLLLIALACAPPQPEETPIGPEPVDPSGGLGFQDFYTTFNSLEELPLAREQFIADSEGLQVTWEGYVLDVAEFGPDETTLVLMAAEFEPEDLAYFHFGNEWQELLYSFDQHDRVELMGIIEHFKGAPKLKGTSARLLGPDD
jgi:hypothetical protein